MRLLLLTLLTACVPKGAVVEDAPETATREGRNDIRLDLARMLLDGGNPAEAQRVLALAEREDADPDELRLLRGEALYLSGLSSEAADMLYGFHEKRPNDPRPLRVLALIEADRGNVETSIGLWKELVRIDPKDAAAWNNLGFLLMSRQEYPEAKEALSQAVARDSGTPRYKNNLGFVLMALGQPKDALDAFRSAGTEADAQYNLGTAYEIAADSTAALLHYQKALRADPHHEPTRRALTRLSPQGDTP